MSIKSFEDMVLPKGTTIEQVIQQCYDTLGDRANRPQNMKEANKLQEERVRQAWLARENQPKPTL